jgi:hypothetical protein
MVQDTIYAPGEPLLVINMSDIDLLFVSNGHGEDAIAARIAKEIQGFRSAALPLVGAGMPYRNAGISVLGPARALPSGGWGLQRPVLLLGDLRRGLIRTWQEALAAARLVKPRLVVGIGDILPAAFAAMAGLPPIVLVACNKTDYYRSWGESYLAAEVAALRAWDAEILPRDDRTHQRLRRLGLRSRFLGNVMPDLVGDLPAPGHGMALLPGSREDARTNLPVMLEALRKLRLGKQTEGRACVALAPGFEDLARDAEAAGVAAGDLEQALAPAGVAIATAGTAAEVAAAHGRHVVAFPGPGPQYTVAFAHRQKQLLGDAMTLCPRESPAIAMAVARALSDEALRARTAEIGRQRIGSPGAASRIAEYLQAR